MSPVLKSSRKSASPADAQAISHDRWFRARVEASLADSRPLASHADVMAEVDVLIDTIEASSPRSSQE